MALTLLPLIVAGSLAGWTAQAAGAVGSGELVAAPKSAAPATNSLAGKAPDKKAPARKKKPSWKVVHNEQFTKSALPAGCTPYAGKYSAGANAWNTKEVQVRKGVLNLRLEKRKTPGRAYTSGGLACLDWAQKYGRYEVRARVPAGKGIDSTIALWPANAKLGAWTGLELLAPGPDAAYVTNGYSTGFDRAKVDGSYAGKYHAYTIEWSPKQVRMLVDGKQVYYSARAFTGKRWFAMVVSSGDQLTGVPDENTKLPASFQVDSVKMWSYTGVPPKVPAVTTTPTPTPTPAPPTPAPSTSAAAGAATPAPSNAPTSTTTSIRAVSTDKDSPALAGGIWPWLLGGSLIAGAAMFTLSYPGHRRAARQKTAAPDHQSD